MAKQHSPKSGNNKPVAIVEAQAVYTPNFVSGAPAYMRAAAGQLDVQESDSGRYLAEFGLPVGTDWCAAFVGWCLAAGGLTPSGSPAARSYAHWDGGRPKPTSLVQRGDVVVYARGASWQGHVGFYVGKSARGWDLVLGGNQTNKVCVAEQDPDKRVAVAVPFR